MKLVEEHLSREVKETGLTNGDGTASLQLSNGSGSQAGKMSDTALVSIEASFNKFKRDIVICYFLAAVWQTVMA